ncbi:MAG: glutaredoxin family protein [Pseudomonadota bacterium]|nr:glutaredoxin family protein [Pseudomonadota bacterium]
MITIAAWQAWPIINHQLNPPVALAPIPAGSVVLYSTAWCGYCTKTRNFLTDNQIPFAEHDVEKSPEAYREYQALGGKGVPVVRVNDQVLHGYDPKGIITALR